MLTFNSVTILVTHRKGYCMGKQILTFTKEICMIVEKDSIVQAEDMFENGEITNEQLNELGKDEQWKLTMSDTIS